MYFLSLCILFGQLVSSWCISCGIHFRKTESSWLDISLLKHLSTTFFGIWCDLGGCRGWWPRALIAAITTSSDFNSQFSTPFSSLKCLLGCLRCKVQSGSLPSCDLGVDLDSTSYNFRLSKHGGPWFHTSPGPAYPLRMTLRTTAASKNESSCCWMWIKVAGLNQKGLGIGNRTKSDCHALSRSVTGNSDNAHIFSIKFTPCHALSRIVTVCHG